MTTATNPDEQFQTDLNRIELDITSLQSKVRLATLRDKVEDLQTTINGMGQDIANLREKGYAFERELENQAADYVTQWVKLKSGVVMQIEQQARSLQAALRPLETQVTQIAGQNHRVAGPLLAKIESGIQTLEGNVTAAERSIGGMFDKFDNQVYQTTKHLKDIKWMLSELAEASFTLLATESGIMAVKAIWAKDGKERKDDPEGVLYLTDQRLIFEQKEEVATKKVLFVATEKKLVQEKRWETPVATIENAKARKEGFMKKDDFIDIQLGNGAPFDALTLHIWQPADEWVALLKHAKAKEFDATRAIAIAAEEVEKVKSAPTQCPSCGGTINQVVLRGMDSISCEYCGAVIRL